MLLLCVLLLLVEKVVELLFKYRFILRASVNPKFSYTVSDSVCEGSNPSPAAILKGPGNLENQGFRGFFVLFGKLENCRFSGVFRGIGGGEVVEKTMEIY